MEQREITDAVSKDPVVQLYQAAALGEQDKLHQEESRKKLVPLPLYLKLKGEKKQTLYLKNYPLASNSNSNMIIEAVKT